MSNYNYPKKRRLDSEVSQASGMSVLSNITRSTDITNYSDESQCDYTDPNSSGPVINSRFDFPEANLPQKAQIMVKNNIPARTRQISFNLDDADDDEDDIQGQVRGQRSAVFGPTYHRYDNRKPFMVRRNRDRRATESCIQNIEHETEGSHMLRSNTTTEFRHQQQLEQDRRTDQLVQEFDANKRARCASKKISMQGRSQSVTSLRNSEHLYTSLIPDTPQNTLVKIPNNNNYIHPVTQLVPNTNNSTRPHRFERTDNTDNTSQTSSRYLRVETEFNPQPVPQSRCCHEKSFRKGFYLLLLLNMIFILLNVFGLPFAYVTIQDHRNSRDPQMCTKCDYKNMKTNNLETFGIQVDDEGNCCLPQLDDFINGVIKKIEGSKLVSQPSNETVLDNNRPMIQLRSESISDTSVLVWKKNVDFRLDFGNVEKDGHIKVPMDGYYYIYTRVMFDVNKKDVHGKCMLGHHVKKSDRDDNSRTIIDSYEENCANASVINHSGHSEIVRFLEKGDSVFVELSYEKVVHKPSIFGMFWLSK